MRIRSLSSASVLSLSASLWMSRLRLHMSLKQSACYDQATSPYIAQILGVKGLKRLSASVVSLAAIVRVPRL